MKVPPALVYAAIALVIMLPLLGPGYFITLDMQMGPNSFADFQFGDFYGFETNPYGAYLPLRLAMAALSAIVPIEIVQKALLFSVLFLCGLGMHMFLPEKYGSSRYFAGLLYMLNPFVFIRFIVGHWSLLLSYALWPLCLKAFMEFMDRPGDRRALAKAAVLMFMASISSHGAVMLLLCCLFAFALHASKKGIGKGLFPKSIALAALVLFMNLFWALPFALAFNQAYSPASTVDYLRDFGASGGEMPVSLAVATMHGFWRDGYTYTKDVLPLWPLPFIAIALLCFAGFLRLLDENRQLALLMLAMLFAGFFLSLGQASPHAGLLEALGTPLYFAFRDSQKFVALIAFAYSVLGACGASFAMEKMRGVWRHAALLAILAIPLAYNYGFFGFLGQAGVSQYPQDWYEADRIIAADPAQSSILALPPHLYYYSPWVASGDKTVGNPISQFFSRPAIVSNAIETDHVQSDSPDPADAYVGWMFRNRQFINNTADLLAPLNVRYVLLFRDDPDHIHYQYLFERVSGMPGIERVLETPSLYLFRNTRAGGPFISMRCGFDGFDSLLNLSPDDYSSDVEVAEQNPASYYVLSSHYPEVVFAGQYNGFLSFGGSDAYPWNGFATGFEFTGPGVFHNRMFPIVLGLLLLSWAVAMALSFDAGRSGLAALLAAAFVMFLLCLHGIAGPVHAGALYLLSAAAFIVYWGRNGIAVAGPAQR